MNYNPIYHYTLSESGKSLYRKLPFFLRQICDYPEHLKCNIHHKACPNSIFQSLHYLFLTRRNKIVRIVVQIYGVMLEISKAITHWLESHFKLALKVFQLNNIDHLLASCQLAKLKNNLN